MRSSGGPAPGPPPGDTDPRTRQVAILDYGMGNLRSVEKALEHVGAGVEVTSDAARVRAADGVVLPGVGAFPKAIERVRELGLDELLHERRDAGVPILGICLGMQLLFESTTELGGATGIGLLAGDVELLDAPGLKVPHIGWSPVSWRGDPRLARPLPDPCAFYHIHSFTPRPADPADVAGTAVYGTELVTVVERAPVYGTQFHPEKSGPHGLALLANFVGICSSGSGASGGSEARPVLGGGVPGVSSPRAV